MLDIVRGSGGSEWMWISATETQYGYNQSAGLSGPMVLFFPAVIEGQRARFVTLGESRVAMTEHRMDPETGKVTAVTYYGTCEAAG